MGFYEAAKDALKIAQKADNIELVQNIMDIQKEALDMQDRLHQRSEEILNLKEKIKSLESRKKYEYELGHKWLINPDNSNIKLCPTCMNRDNFESPLAESYDDNYRYCGNCKNTIQ